MHWCETYYSLLVALCIDGNVFVVTRKEPVGVAGQIIPWVSFYFILLRFISSHLQFELIVGKLNCLKIELSSFDARLEMGSGSGCGMHYRHETG